jgi:hypothetical protein
MSPCHTAHDSPAHIDRQPPQPVQIPRPDHRFPIDLEIPQAIRGAYPESRFGLGIRFHQPMFRPWVASRMFGNLLSEADIGENGERGDEELSGVPGWRISTPQGLLHLPIAL